MKTQFYLLTVICLGLTKSINAQTQNQMENVNFNTEQKNVMAVITKMTTAFENKKIDEVMDCYEANATIVFEPESPESNSAVLREMFTAMSMLNPIFTYSGHEVFISGNIATHIAPWTMTGTAEDGSEIIQSGLSIATLRKQPNGEWLIIFDNPHGAFLLNKE